MPTIGSRCQRILQEAPRQKRTVRTRIRSLPENVVMKLWRTIILKAFQLFHFMEVRQVTVDWLGPQAVQLENSASSSSEDPWMSGAMKPRWERVLMFKGESFVVGQAMEPGQGKVDAKNFTHDPAMCQHPIDKMKGRGNLSSSLWWMCAACGQRWKRIPLSQYEPKKAEPLSDLGLITFGKYTGHTYLSAWNLDKNWCQLQMMIGETEDASFLNKRFAQYLVQKEIDENIQLSEYEIPAGRIDMEL